MKKWEKIYIFFGVFDEYWRFLISTLLLKGQHKYYLRFVILSNGKMEIFILKKPKKISSCKTVSRFIQQLKNILNVFIFSKTLFKN